MIQRHDQNGENDVNYIEKNIRAYFEKFGEEEQEMKKVFSEMARSSISKVTMLRKETII